MLITVLSLRRCFLLIVICGFMTRCTCSTTQPLIIDHDAGVDDFISSTLQLLYAPARIKAITIVPADSFAEPAVVVMKQLKNLLHSGATIPLGVSSNEGINKFPSVWREDSWKLTRLPVWDEETRCADQLVSSAVDVLIDVLRTTTEPVDLLETGPCTNIAEVLRIHPELSQKIHRMYMMGGAVYVNGNVQEQGHDGSAEWNIYNNPEAFKTLLSSGVPLTLVSLDATQYTPIRHEFMAALQQRCAEKQFEFVYESLRVIQPLIDNGQYMFWDTLTSAVVINPNIIKTKKVKINVVLTGPSMGKTFEDEKNGFEIDLAIWADQKLFEKTVLEVLSKSPGNVSFLK